jgi:type I restriction enzyme, S subunit
VSNAAPFQGGSIEIPLPPLEEQHEIARRVEQLFALADALEAKYANARAHVTGLEQALLAKAFRGELAAPDPHDEPAEVLLQRILAAKAQIEAGSKKSRQKKP